MLLTLTPFFPLHSVFFSIYLSHHSGDLWKRLVHEFVEGWRAIQPSQHLRVTAALIQSKRKLLVT